MSAPPRRRRGRAWTRLGYGIQMPSGLEGREALIAELRVWQPLLPQSAVWTVLTALRLHGLWLPPLPPALPHFVAMGTVPGEVKPDRDRLLVSRHPSPPARTQVDGLPLAPVPDALLAAARHLGLLDLVCLVDSALPLGLCGESEIRAAAAPRRKGAPALRAALDVADARAESLWETVLRMLHHCLGVPVLPQAVVRDGDGVFVARADLLVVGTTTLHEHDGAQHREPEQHREDLRRERALVSAGYMRRGYTADIALHSPHLVQMDCEATLGRPLDPAGMTRWLALVAGSLQTRQGQRAVLRRLGVPAD